MQPHNTFRHILTLGLGLALCLLQPLVQAESETLERIEWKKAPIRLELTVGQEQRIEFPAAVKVGVPESLQSLLRTQSVNGTVYLLAHAPFGSNRLLVRELDSGRIYLFDVTASEEGGASHPMQIYVADTASSGNDSATAGHDADRGPPGYIQLTRFAAQQLYAPTRLLKEHPGIGARPGRAGFRRSAPRWRDRGHPVGGVARQWSVCHGGQAHQPHRTSRRPWIRGTCGATG